MIRILFLQLLSVITLFAAQITLNKATYTPQENIEITLANMPGNEGDWVGIFPKDSESIWDNVKTWKHDGAVVDGTYILDGVGAGEYEARVFLHNSYTQLAKSDFSVEEKSYNVAVTTSKPTFEVGEGITVTLSNMPGLEGDWVGVYPKDSNDSWENILTWKHDGAVIDGTYTLDSVEAGGYEVRVFLNNSFTRLAVTAFDVQEKQLNTTVTTNKNWGSAACFDFGTRVMTLQGERIMLFSVWYGNKNFIATKTVYSDSWIELVYPITRDLAFENRQQHVKLNLQEYLEILEPGNKILSIQSFITTGGNYVLDNLRLSSE